VVRTRGTSIRISFLASCRLSLLVQASLVSPVQAVAALLPLAMIGIGVVINLGTQATELALLVSKAACVAEVERLAVDIAVSPKCGLGNVAVGTNMRFLGATSLSNVPLLDGKVKVRLANVNLMRFLWSFVDVSGRQDSRQSA
jgi:hypothetical protein